MKKKIVLFLFALFLVLIIKNYILIDTEDTLAVMASDNQELNLNDTSFHNFYLLFDTYKIDTKDLENLYVYFANYEYKIIAVYLSNKSLYINKLGATAKIMYSGSSLKEGINNIHNQYKTILIDNGLEEEASIVDLQGVGIKMISMYTSNLAMSGFLQKYSDIKYSFDGNNWLQH